MTFEQFREKLTPFFTPSQIGNLDRQAISDALDAMTTTGKAEPDGDLTKWDVFKSLHDMGRDFIIYLINDTVVYGRDELCKTIDVDLTLEQFDKLISAPTWRW